MTERKIDLLNASRGPYEKPLYIIHIKQICEKTFLLDVILSEFIVNCYKNLKMSNIHLGHIIYVILC